jgi:hypothetical protein
LFLLGHLACDSDGALPPSGSGGTDVASGGRHGGSGGSSGGNETGGSSGAPSDGGTGALSSGGTGGNDDPGPGGASAGGAAGSATGDTAGAGGSSGGASAGAGGASEDYVNDCTSFVDRTAPAAARSLTWDESLRSTAVRCIMIRVGQSVSFDGDFEQHPLLPLGGDEPNPVAASAVYDVPGTYGYYCPVHPLDMNGAILVVP